MNLKKPSFSWYLQVSFSYHRQSGSGVDKHLTLTSGVVQIRGSNGFGQFWPFMGCWGRLPLGCMHTNFGAHWAPRGRAGVPLFFLLSEFCNGWFSSVCDIWEPILGGYGNHPWPLTNHHKKGWAFLSFSARTSFLDFLGPTLSPNWLNSSHMEFDLIPFFGKGISSRLREKNKIFILLSHFGEKDHPNFGILDYIDSHVPVRFC